MFFPTDILVRKGRFGVVWLAATHSSERTSVLTRRDYLKVNIPRTCHDIIYPVVPFALRLSSHLMLGVARIFGKQTKFFLDETTQIWIRAHEALALSSKTLKLASPVSRHEFITMSDPVENETMQYAVEPFRLDLEFDPAFLYASDSGYMNVNGNIFLSPSSSVRSSSSEMMSSPFQAHQKDITIPEVPFPADRPIEVANEDFISLSDEDPFINFGAKMDDMTHNVPEAAPGSPKDPVTVAERSRADQAGQETPVSIVHLPTPVLGVNTTTVMEDPAKRDKPPPHEMSWEEIANTPPVVRPVGRAPARPRKRKRLAIDMEKTMSGDEMRTNLVYPLSTLQKRNLPGKRVLSVNELFSQPAATYLANEYMAAIWHHNARTFPNETLHENFRIMDEQTEMDSPDRNLRINETPSSIEMPRLRPEISTEFEQSATSTLIFERTPHPQEESRQTNLSGAERVLHRLTPRENEGLAEIPNLSPILDDPLDNFNVSLEEIDENEPATEIGQDDIPSPKQEQFLRLLSDHLANKEIILFSDIAPPRTTRRKMAAKFFTYALAFHARQVIELDQVEMFGEISICRGPLF